MANKLESFDIGRALMTVLVSPNECDSNGEPACIVDGLFAIARALNGVAVAVERLGLGNASTQQGAMEVLAGEVKKGFETLALCLPTPEDIEELKPHGGRL